MGVPGNRKTESSIVAPEFQKVACPHFPPFSPSLDDRDLRPPGPGAGGWPAGAVSTSRLLGSQVNPQVAKFKWRRWNRRSTKHLAQFRGAAILPSFRTELKRLETPRLSIVIDLLQNLGRFHALYVANHSP